jgi:hypothetical protein
VLYISISTLSLESFVDCISTIHAMERKSKFKKPDLHHTNGCNYSDCTPAQQPAVDSKLNLTLLLSLLI